MKKLFLSSILILSFSHSLMGEEKLVLREETQNISGSAWKKFKDGTNGTCRVARCIYEVSSDSLKKTSQVRFGLESDDGCGLMFGDTVHFQNSELPLVEGHNSKAKLSNGGSLKTSYKNKLLEINRKEFFCDVTDGCPFTRYSKTNSTIEYSKTDLISIKSIKSSESEPAIIGFKNLNFTCVF